MSKKRITIMMFILTLALSGCQSKAVESVDGETDAVASTGEIEEVSENIQSIIELVGKLDNEGLTVEEYHKLAELYAKEGSIRQQRDILEQCYRLYQDESTLELLKDIQVNANEEDNTILSKIKGIMDDLKLEDSYLEVIEAFGKDETMVILLPKADIVSRQYYYTDASGDTLYLEVESGNHYKATLMKKNGELVRINYLDNQLQLLTGHYKGEKHDGDFTLWTIDSGSGSITKEEGSLKSDVLSGDYSLSTCMVKGATVSELWRDKDTYTYDSFTGSFDEDGKAGVAQPAIKGYEESIAYAYDESGKNCIYVPKAEVDNEVFGIDFLRLDMIPSVKTYEIRDAIVVKSPGEDGMVARDDIKVRVFDGMIQWFDGSNWNDAGSVDTMAERDPFVVAKAGGDAVSALGAEGAEAGDSLPSADTGVMVAQSLVKNVTVGSAVETKPAPNKKNNNKKNNDTNNNANTQVAAGAAPAQVTPGTPGVGVVAGAAGMVAANNGGGSGDSSGGGGYVASSGGGSSSGGGGGYVAPSGGGESAPTPSAPPSDSGSSGGGDSGGGGGDSGGGDSGGGDSGGGDSGGGDSGGDTDSEFSAEVD